MYVGWCKLCPDCDSGKMVCTQDFNCTLRPLVGKIVSAVEVADYNDIRHGCIVFHCDGYGRVCFLADGCCSESWVSEVSGIAAILNKRITRVDVEPVDTEWNDTLGGDDAARDTYMFRLVVDDTRIATITMRCTHNGYYGGNFIPILDSTYDRCACNKKNIVDDWSSDG